MIITPSERGSGGFTSLNYKDGNLYRLANILMLAWPYGYPMIHSSHQFASVGSMLRIAVDGLFVLVRVSVYLYVILLIAQAMLSWFNPHAPLNRLVGQMTAPVLRPLQRIVPPISDIDLTPLIAILLAQIILIFV